MATGIPKTQSNGIGQGHTDSEVPSDTVLQYEGKQPPDEILKGARAEHLRVWTATTEGTHSASPNRLYYAENLSALLSLLDDPDISGKVRLVYIDPPFATRSVFQSRGQVDAYSDLLMGSHYLEFLRRRLIVLRELLADDGSIFVHLDDKMICHVKIIMDEIFGKAQFRNLITRKKCNPKNYTRKAFGNVADFILFYTKTDRYVWNRPIEAWTPERALKEYEYLDAQTGRRYKKVPVHAPGVRNGETGKPWRGMLPPPGKHWQYKPSTLDELDERGEIYWSPNGNPRRKVYLDQSEGVAVQDLWLGFRDAHNQNIRVTGYPTEKNPELLSRIIGASSNDGDIVLDCFSGSGTTLAMADSLRRRWIGIDNSKEAISTTLRRFAHGVPLMGDFVAKRLEGDRQKQSLPLFVDSGPARAIENRNHDPITRFSLWTETGLVPQAKPLVREWQSWIADPPIEVSEVRRARPLAERDRATATDSRRDNHKR
jgi:adenine-specific DNA-methyltransferase